MAYSIDVRKKALAKIEKGEKIKDISQEMGISIPTLYNWKKADKKEKEEVAKKERDYKTAIRRPKEKNGVKTYRSKPGRNEIIASKHIKYLISQKRFAQAKKMGEPFKNNMVIQSQMITVAIKERDYKTAKEIGRRFPDNAPIQSQMVTIAIEEGDYKTAKEIGRRFTDYAPIQSQMITVAIEEGDYETAKEIGRRFPDDATIQSQMAIVEKAEGCAPIPAEMLLEEEEEEKEEERSSKKRRRQEFLTSLREWETQKMEISGSNTGMENNKTDRDDVLDDDRN